jgi:hypothetical protein
MPLDLRCSAVLTDVAGVHLHLLSLVSMPLLAVGLGKN